MAAGQEHFQLLDQLQNELNRVLEQAGRIFADAQNDPKSVPIVRASRLKQMTPGSVDRFHGALDQLEDELHLARVVLRRDLAVCRERAGVPKPAQANSAASTVSKKEPVDQETVVSVKDTEKPGPSEDVIMLDAQPNESVQPEKQPEQDATTETGLKDLAQDSEKEMTEPAEQSSAQPDAANADDKPANSALQIDTQSGLKEKSDSETKQGDADEDQPPDTGTFSNNADMESLFGVPTSAGADGDGPEDFNADLNNPSAFDFDSFDTAAVTADDNNAVDNDSISALLPGLQDYANTQPASESGEIDFDALFAADLPDGQGDGGQDSSERRESTFDDLMNFADFNAGDFAAGSNAASGVEGNQEFDFSFD